jgi:cysteine-S-conjugate beta-lyase
MMAFDFDHAPDRRGTDSGKWAYFGPDVLPMWVADMDFTSPPAIVEALQERVAHGVFGYGWDNANLRAAVVERMARLYDWHIKASDIFFLPGLVSGLNLVSQAVGEPGDSVVVHTPVYGPFLSAPVNQGRTLRVAPLKLHNEGQCLYYTVDYERFESVIDASTRMFILCNPHNPVGRVFQRDELLQMADICEQHNLVICSDEIHCDLLMDNMKHIPIASLSPEIAQRTVTLMAPSKTFNVPGLGFSMAIVQNVELRKKIERAATGIVPHANILGVVAAEAAYTRCDDWLRELNAYLTANRDYAVAYLQRELPAARVTCPEATYLLWVDCRELGIEGTPSDFFLKRAKVAGSDGKSFGEGGEGFVRLNYGCPRYILQKGLELLVESIRNGQ